MASTARAVTRRGSLGASGLRASGVPPRIMATVRSPSRSSTSAGDQPEDLPGVLSPSLNRLRFGRQFGDRDLARQGREVVFLHAVERRELAQRRDVGRSAFTHAKHPKEPPVRAMLAQ